MLSISKTITLFLATLHLGPVQEDVRNITCAESQSPLIKAAIVGGKEIVNDVLALRTQQGGLSGTALQMTPSMNEIEHKYFGKLEDNDRQFITDMFTFVNDSWDQRNWICRGFCKNSTIPGERPTAFVNPNLATTVFICPFLFEKGSHASALRNNSVHIDQWISQSSILVHEMLHTNLNSTTGEMLNMPTCFSRPPCRAYGSERTHVLSVDAPDRALRNADNYIFYALELIRARQNASRRVVKESRVGSDKDEL